MYIIVKKLQIKLKLVRNDFKKIWMFDKVKNCRTFLGHLGGMHYNYKLIIIWQKKILWQLFILIFKKDTATSSVVWFLYILHFWEGQQFSLHDAASLAARSFGCPALWCCPRCPSVSSNSVHITDQLLRLDHLWEWVITLEAFLKLFMCVCVLPNL